MASPPAGTLTFLFTDIEGSTKMWERDPEAMQTALARHDEILRGTTEQHGGHVFKPWRPSGGSSLPNGSRQDPLG
jgi:class 3 adenylate cyclase